MLDLLRQCIKSRLDDSNIIRQTNKCSINFILKMKGQPAIRIIPNWGLYPQLSAHNKTVSGR